MISPQTLTDFEVAGLRADFNLADGHAYQDLPDVFAGIVSELPALWRDSELRRVPESEDRFRSAFAELAGSGAMSHRPFFKICPSASNSIDVIATVLATRRIRTSLLEPTFDNLHLLLQRRGVTVSAVTEDSVLRNGAAGIAAADIGGALFIVQPNNPTGYCTPAATFVTIAEYCKDHQIVLVIDNSFRFFNRSPFDDYEVLKDIGVSFISCEDTGKVWPTHDLKASLLFCSADLQEIVNSVYNETYLCNSRFGLAILERFLRITSEVGLARSIWPTVDKHRELLRATMESTALTSDTRSSASQISVDWLDCRATGLRDLELSRALADLGVLVLPGRLFFWQSADVLDHRFNIRVALMKPERRFEAAVAALADGVRQCRRINGI